MAAAGAAAGADSPAAARFARSSLTAEIDARSASARPAAATAWCGAAAQADRVPNAVAGNPVHWVYLIPSDGTDSLGAVANAMQSDADQVDAWWRGQDPSRVPRNDMTTFSCGTQLDITTVRSTLSGSELTPISNRFSGIIETLERAGFSSPLTKYLVYYDGPIDDDNICGQGGSDSNGFGVAVVYYRSCIGVSTAAVAAHEFLHTIGAVPTGAPNECTGENAAHTCDNESDLMYPAVGSGPLSVKVLDPGRNDYYGHAGSVARHAGLRVARAARQPGAARPYRVRAWLRRRRRPRPAVLVELHHRLELGPAPRADCDSRRGGEARALGRRMLGQCGLQRHRRPRREAVGALRAGNIPPDRRRHGEGRGSELGSGHRLSASLLGELPLVLAHTPDCISGEGVEAQVLERRLPRLEEGLHGADERGDERPRDVHPRLTFDGFAPGLIR